MDDQIRRALRRGHTIDITTLGRQSGQPRRIELVFHVIEGRVIISGLPGRRDWYANLLADPRFTFHLTGPIKADLPATARPIVEPEERRRIMTQVARNWNREFQLELMMARSPLIEVLFDEALEVTTDAVDSQALAATS
jgi:deazaflavin-dependent oxidoreductase (nitroreductase family)